MERLGIHTGADLARWSQPELEAHFGSSGRWYWRIARGIDEREVKPDRPYKSVSAERTFDSDLSDSEALSAELERVAGFAWQRIDRAEVRGRTVTLKVKFGDFTIITRSQSFRQPIADEAASAPPARRCWRGCSRFVRVFACLALACMRWSMMPSPDRVSSDWRFETIHVI